MFAKLPTNQVFRFSRSVQYLANTKVNESRFIAKTNQGEILVAKDYPFQK